MKRLSRLLFFAAVTTLLFFVLVEGALRLVGDPPPIKGATEQQGAHQLPPYMTADAGVGWRGTPGAQWPDPNYQRWARGRGQSAPLWDGFSTNSLGFRDTELAEPRPAQQVRIMSLGDSSVAGSGCPRLETFSERLEKSLNDPWVDDASARGVEVINTGVPGYSVVQSLFTLERHLDLGLDGVLVYNMNSDLMMTDGVTDDILYDGWRQTAAGLNLARFQLWSWMRWAIRPPAQPRKSQTTTRVPMPLYARNLERIAQLGVEHSFKPIFIIATSPADLLAPIDPELYQVNSPSKVRDAETYLGSLDSMDVNTQNRENLRLIMSLVGYRRGIPVVDAPAAMNAAWRQGQDRYQDPSDLFVDELHPSGEGHRIIAEATLPHLKALVEEAQARRGQQGGG